MAFKLLAGAALAAVAFADEPVGTVIGIDLGTTYSVRRVHHRLAPAAPLLGAGSPATLRLPPAQRRSAAATLQPSAEN
jgi:hypothetical protein